MSKDIDDGGLAFPGTRFEAVKSPIPNTWENVAVQYPGMSLRDYFAGQALTGLTAAGNYDNDDGRGMAATAYKYADGMIAVKGERND